MDCLAKVLLLSCTRLPVVLTFVAPTPSRATMRRTPSLWTSASSLVLNETTVFPSPLFVWNQTLATTEIGLLETMIDTATVTTIPDDTMLEEKRNRLKKQLAQTAITNFISEDVQSHGINEDTAESIMKKLEQLNPLPVARPASHYSLNANGPLSSLEYPH